MGLLIECPKCKSRLQHIATITDDAPPISGGVFLKHPGMGPGL